MPYNQRMSMDSQGELRVAPGFPKEVEEKLRREDEDWRTAVLVNEIVLPETSPEHFVAKRAFEAAISFLKKRNLLQGADPTYDPPIYPTLYTPCSTPD